MDDGGSPSLALLLKGRQDALAQLLSTPAGRDTFNASEAARQKAEGDAYQIAQARRDAYGFVNSKTGQLNGGDSTWDILGMIPFLAGGAALAGGAGLGAGAAETGGAAAAGGEGLAGMIPAEFGDAAAAAYGGADAGLAGLGAEGGGLLGSAGAGAGAATGAGEAGGLLGGGMQSVTIGAPAGYTAGATGGVFGPVAGGAAGLSAADALAGMGGPSYTSAPATTTPPKSTLDQIKSGVQTANNTKNVIGAMTGSGQPAGGNMAATNSTTTQQIDPRIAQILFGDGTGTGTNAGLLAQYQGMLGQPQGAGTAALGTASQDWLKSNAGGVLGQLQTGANGLLGSNYSAPHMPSTQAAPTATSTAATATAPTMPDYTRATAAAPVTAAQAGSSGYTAVTNTAPTNITGATAAAPNPYTAAQAGASQVNAPAQNNLDLTKAYQDVISGNAAENPYLTKSLQSAVDMTNTSYNKNLTDTTNTLQRSVLPGIRSNSVLSGQYGGTRQGIAEGNAIGDYTNQLNSANLALGQANSANTTGAQAQAFNQGQDRALTAMTSLGAQQYGVAQQNSAQAQAAALANAAATNNASQTVYGGDLSTNLANAGYAQGANLNNYQGQLNTGLANTAATNAAAAQTSAQANATGIANAGFSNQTNLANAGNQQQTNLANAGFSNQSNLTNYQGLLGTALANSGNQQQTGLANAAATNQGNQFNAGLTQAGNLANLQSQLTTNNLNSSNQQAGLSGLSGLLGQINGTATAADNHNLVNAGAVNSLLAPYIGLNGTTTQTTPQYTNTGANIVGGLTAGAGILNGLGGVSGLSSLFGNGMTNDQLLQWF